jgi:hypothetical protein
MTVEGGGTARWNERAVDIQERWLQTKNYMQLGNRCKVRRMKDLSITRIAIVSLVLSIHHSSQAECRIPRSPSHRSGVARPTVRTDVIHVPPGSDAGYDIPDVRSSTARGQAATAVVSGAHRTEYASILAVEMLIGADPVRQSIQRHCRAR